VIDHSGVVDVASSAAVRDAALQTHGAIHLPSADSADAVGRGVDDPVFWMDCVQGTAHGVRGPDPSAATEQPTAFAADPSAADQGASTMEKAERNVKEGDRK
jgi:hypothetical protein